MNTFDLQIQSTASDGEHTPKELVGMSREQGLTVISITDHDTVDGVPEALLAGEELGVRVIPGIELSVEEHSAHILALGVDYQNTELLSELEKFRQSRIEGNKKMVENLKSVGFVLEWEDVLKEVKGRVVARPHIVEALMHRPENKARLEKEGILVRQDFFKAYLSNESPLFVSRTHISAKDALGLIHRAGGVAVWSHPPVPDFIGGNYEELEVFLKELRSWGLDGIEVFSPSHTEDDAEFLQGLAVKYALLRTAGSDFHVRGARYRDGATLRPAQGVGDYETFGFPTDDIIPKLDEAIQKRRNS